MNFSGVCWEHGKLGRHLLFLDPHVKHLAKLGANTLRPGVRLNFSKKVGESGGHLNEVEGLYYTHIFDIFDMVSQNG